MDPALWELLRAEEVVEDRVVEAIIRFRRPGVEVPGVRIVSRFGRIATCRLAISSIRQVRRHADVVSLKAPRPLGPEYETFTVDQRERNPPDVRPTDSRRGPDLPLTGAGVVVAAVDWGIDFDHPNFKANDGTTRLLALWDQRPNTSGQAPRPYGYGTVHEASQINRALRTREPYEVLGYHPGAADRGGGSHGTHVLDIAAGNGRAPGPTGVAPAADLVFVHLADRNTGGLANLGDSVRLLEAVDFIRRTAGERPWVVNISIGRHGGPHDGTTLIELAFDALLSAAPGCFVSDSTGNYWRSGTHASGVLGQGQVKTLSFVTDPADTSENELEIWYGGADEFVVRIDPPGGGGGPAVRLGSRAELIAGGQVVGRVYHRANDPNNHDNHVDAFLLPRGSAGTWTVTIEAERVKSGRFHAWLERDEVCKPCQARFTANDRDSTCTTGTIANSRVPLVVAAYDAHSRSRPVAAFSSSGPTRDGRDKPDLAAPGVEILAARSAQLGLSQSPGELVRKSGSSMAAPHVTGAVALCLQAGRHRLDAQRIRALVLGTVQPSTTKDSEHRLGRGYLDIPRLVAASQIAFPVRGPRNEPKDSAMNTDLDTSFPLAIAPARAYRELLYHPGGRLSRLIGERFDIIARPGQRLSDPPRAGDVMLQVTVGHLGGGSCAVLVDSGVTRRRAGGVRGAAGWYAEARNAAAPSGPLQLRILDASGSVSPGQLLLRPRSTDLLDDVATEHEFDEDGAEDRTPVPVDLAAAVPPFNPSERANIVQPLLSARESEKAVAWSTRVHPATSGVTFDEIRGALANYVDAAAVQAATGASSAATDVVLVECVHQFQVKCYIDRREHDGHAGESTLDTLGLIARVGSGLRGADRGNAKAQERLRRRNAAIKTATRDEFSAENWFDRMADPSVFGLRTKNGNGLHVTVLRKLRLAERHLLTLPAFAGKTPAGLGTALGLTEKHGGARPTQTQSTSVHTFGLALDIAYAANPWVRSAASWAALQRASSLVSGTSLTQTSAPEYFSSLGSDPSRSTGQIWDEIQKRSAELISYLALGKDDAALRAALEAGQARGTVGLLSSGESLHVAAKRWGSRIRQDRQALTSGDFDGHVSPERSFLTHSRDLVIALRDHGCLAWGAVDLGPGARGSGDMMHYDARVDGAGRVLTENTQAFLPTAGHPCLPRGGGSTDTEEESAPESAPDNAKDTIRAHAERWGTDEAAVMSALGGLLPSEMAELSADGAIVDSLRDELSGAERAAAVVGPCPDVAVPVANRPRLLIRGSVHPAVRDAQRRLNIFSAAEVAAGRPSLSDVPLREDCIFGPAMQRALISFQQRVFPGQPREQDGRFGPKSWAELDRVTAVPGPAPPPPPPPFVPPAPPSPPLTAINRPRCCMLASLSLRGSTTIGGHGTDQPGIVYTGRAGFVDLGHLWEVADATAFAYQQIHAAGGASGTTVRVAEGIATLTGTAPATEWLELARSIAFDDALGHEITTYTAMTPGGHNSSFSPEDLCSNFLGTEVAARALAAGGPFITQAEAQLRTLLASLDAQNAAETKASFARIATRWVDTTLVGTIVRDGYLRRRNFTRHPWKTGHSSDSTTPAFVVAPISLTSTYDYSHPGGFTRVDFARQIAAIRTDAASRYGPDFDRP